ncbi:MAG: nitronate monooxygenase [Gammaproteobacteria bacterium]|nr:nitronate monooxygenase [Gammaproteobacteria bacterium]
MALPLCDQFRIQFPLFAFSHCRDVVVEVSKAGGMGVLGAAGMTPEQLRIELDWIDAHIGGHPYGVDLIVPASFATKGESLSGEALVARIPETYKAFVRDLLSEHEIDGSDLTDERLTDGARLGENASAEGAAAMLDIAFAHPISLLVNALGTPPAYMLERCREAGVPVGALVGSPEHAVKQAQAGVDLVIAQGGEAGGHCGEISTLVLVPQVVDAVAPYGPIPVLAAGGIATGRQMAACMAMGAAGAWTGSVWLTTAEAETSKVLKEKLVAASSRDTIRSKARTGKYSRQLRSAWTDAWEAPLAPDPLPMPLQSIVTTAPMHKIIRLAEGGHAGARRLASYFVGQGVGLTKASVSARTVVYEFMQEFLSASERLGGFLDDGEA